MRRATTAAVLAAVACLGLLAPAAPASAEETTVPVTLSTAAENTSSIAVPVPPGVVPSAITGVLNMTEVPPGTIELLVNGRAVTSVPTALYAQVSVPVTSTDVTAAGTIGLALRYVAAGSVDVTACTGPVAATAVLRKVGLVYTGTETAPTTLSTFFPPAAAGVDVVIPPNAGDDLLAAGLAAVGSLSSRYPDDTPVRLTTSDQQLPAAVAGQRVVLISAGGSTVTTAVSPLPGVPTLALTGSGDALVSAARALGGSALDLANTASTDNLSETLQQRDVGLTRTLTQLGATGLTISGWGESTAHVDVAQDAFGGPVSALRISLVGTHTALPAGATGQLDVHVNGTLVESQALTADTALDLDATVPAGLLRAENDLDVTLTALPDGGCLPTTPQLPLEVALDPEASTVKATRGTTTTGFQGLPQALEGSLTVGLRPTGDQRTAAALQAAPLVSALQRAAAAPLQITLADADDLLAGDDPGLLVGATYTDSIALGVPVRLDGLRQLDNVDAELQVGTDEPFAALQDVRQNGRQVLALGSWSPGASGVAPALATTLVTQVARAGWSDLSGDVLIADGTANPLVALTSDLAPEPSLRASDTDSDSNTLAPFFVIGISLLLFLLMFQLYTVVRRDRRTTGTTPPTRPTARK